MPDSIKSIYRSSPQDTLSNRKVPKLSFNNSGSIFTVGFPLTKIQSFGAYSLSLMYDRQHTTKLLDIAQKYVGNIIEVTDEELKYMLPSQRTGTQVEIIGNGGLPNSQWCAYTVSYMCEKTDIDIEGTKFAVQQFIDWGVKRNFYRPINTCKMTPDNYIQERANRAAQIKQQTKKMHEGDLIIWKSDTMFKTQIGLKGFKASHIGIIEKVNPDGTVVVIEGNANEVRKNNKYERLIATNSFEAKNGNQKIGEFQEINPRDGIIRKIYTVEELAATGYSGYIDMQKIVK